MRKAKMQMGSHKGGPMKGEHRKPELEDLTQTVEQHEDGSVSITLSGTTEDGDVRSKTLTISDAAEGGVELASVNDMGRSKLTTITEDAEDGGVDLDVVCTNEEGETVSRHIELDMNEDGTISFVAETVHDGETLVHERTLSVERFLGEADEALTVAEVVESMLDRGPMDLTEVDLSGISNLATDAGAEIIVV